MKMKMLIATLLIAVALPAVARDTAVRGYTRQNGTYVQPHMRSAPNSTTLDNYSTRGNVNPYTGQAGTRDPAPTYTAPPTYTPPPQPYQYRQPTENQQ